MRLVSPSHPASRRRSARRWLLVGSALTIAGALTVGSSHSAGWSPPQRGPAIAAETAPDAAPAPTPEPTPAARPTPPGQAAAPAPGQRAGAPPPAVDVMSIRAAKARTITAAAARGGAHASFALFDRLSRVLTGDARSRRATNTESVSKVWLAADLLRGVQSGRRPLGPYEGLLRTMIRDSDDNAAEVIYESLGEDASIRRMIMTCGLTDTRITPMRWSLTKMSARDMARLGDCIVPGRALNRASASTLMRLMRMVSMDGDFGIQDAEPAGKGVRIAVKNGWTAHGGSDSGSWNVNCLAMWGPGATATLTPRWVLAVTTQYPQRRGLAYGATICRDVATALFG